MSLADGLYRVDRYGICAGFVIKDGKLAECAPILRRKISWWMTVAVLVLPGCTSVQTHDTITVLVNGPVTVQLTLECKLWPNLDASQ